MRAQGGKTKTAGGNSICSSSPPSSPLHLHPVQTSVWIQLPSGRLLQAGAVKIQEPGGGEVEQTGAGCFCVLRRTICLGVWSKVLTARTLTADSVGYGCAEESFMSYAHSKRGHHHAEGASFAIVCGPPSRN